MNTPPPDAAPPWRERIKDELEAAAGLAADVRAARLAQLSAESPELAAEVHSLLDHLGGSALPHALAQVLPQTPPPQLGPWRLDGELGQGGMGVVYLAHRADGAFEGKAAVKLLPPLLASGPRRTRFLRECQALARLSHPRIARLLDAGTSDEGFAYIVMEHVDGEPIDRWCRRQFSDPRSTLRLLHSLCGALSYMHARLVVHRDLKPSNILVDRDGRVKLLDFGVARLLDEAADAQPTLGEAALTPAYASPEAISGAPIGIAADVFALGTLMYVLLAAQHPFARDGDGTLAVLDAVVHRDPPPPSRVAERRLPADVDAIVMRALAKKPEQRYRSVDALADDLRRFLEGYPVLARPPALIGRLAKWFGRNRWQAAAAGVALLMILGFALRAELQAQASKHQAELAETRLREVRDLAHAVIYDYDPELAKVPGTLQVRRRLVNDALGYLDSLSVEAGLRPDLLTEIAAAYEHIGMLQGQGWYGPNVGDLDAAAASLAKAESLRRALLAVSPQGHDARRALADVLEKRSDLALTRGELHTATALLVEAERALAVVSTVEGHLGAARLALKLGDLAERSAGDGLQQALAHYERQAEHLSAAAAAGAQARQVREQLGYNRYSRALPLMRLGRHAEALDMARESLALHEEIAAQAPADSLGEVLIAMARLRFGEMLWLNGDRSESIAQLRRAETALDAALARDAGDVSLRLRAMRIALALSRVAMPDDANSARQAAERALAHAERLPPQMRAGLGGHLLAHARRALAVAAAARGDIRLAATQFERACRFLEEARGSGRAGARAALDVAQCLQEHAQVAALAGQRPQAQALDARAIALRRQWLVDAPADSENAVQLAQALRLAMALGETSAGSEAERLVREVAARGPLAPLWVRQIEQAPLGPAPLNRRSPSARTI